MVGRRSGRRHPGNSRSKENAQRAGDRATLSFVCKCELSPTPGRGPGDCITSIGGMSRRNNAEAQIQRAIVQHIKARGVPGLVWFHVPNGGSRNKTEAAIFKAMGTRAGVSDLIFFHRSKFFCLELKAPGGRASEAQMNFLSEADAAGAYTAMPTGLDAALATLEAWGLIKPEVTMKTILSGLQAAQ